MSASIQKLFCGIYSAFKPRELVVLGQGCVLGLSLLARRYSCSHTEAVPVCACLSPCPQRFPRNPRGRLGFPGPTQGEG